MVDDPGLFTLLHHLQFIIHIPTLFLYYLPHLSLCSSEMSGLFSLTLLKFEVNSLESHRNS